MGFSRTKKVVLAHIHFFCPLIVGNYLLVNFFMHTGTKSVAQLAEKGA